MDERVETVPAESVRFDALGHITTRWHKRLNEQSVFGRAGAAGGHSLAIILEALALRDPSMSDPNPYRSTDATTEGAVDADTADRKETPNPSRWVKPVIIVALIALAGFLSYQFGDLLSLDSLAQKESELREFQAQHPVLVYGIAFLIYVIVTGLSLPGAAALTLVYGWYFGFWRTVVLVSFASTAGATVAFLMSRYLLKDSVQSKFGDRLESFNQQLQKEGAFYLFTLRLIPAVPFFVINLVMGLTPLTARTFWWVSQLGMLPGTMVFVYAGSRVPNLEVLAAEGANAVFSTSQLIQLAIAFGLLGVFPLVVKKIMNRVLAARTDDQPEPVSPDQAGAGTD